ncbi:YciK family oxidoreductase [Paraglaciecola chathamensis]|jgi:NAD(P)-dependent dehydrogenase (short-subunit alcohol dehydrogenase family)|uniref:YciK family oxidoreductase n=2 Tax=Paraglaciecola chathamensis TaxID=368405 RepID=A0A8H9IF19_9ALTE|nr:MULTISPECIES: YciK family oxidoreductase [Paraglaciecola]AEE23026.1 short-chain dehydrogenase/reductase SDR [Glaciecola sp. 4H-3-7+YE-5]GAC05298.1 short-chain dehydrogenase/reductase SDR [Paraglaciecola agarilytica NO2]GGZ62984.1 YciK family oxidoreductase [Paraglaciecola oceanifecundans]
MFNFQPTSGLLTSKTILVTGAGDGIGKEAALQFAKYGATVILLGRTVSKLEAVYDEIVANGGAEPAIIPLDLQGATPQHYRDMANTIDNQFASLDGVLHNASLLGHLEPFQQINEDDWNNVMQVNVNSQFFMTQALIPVMKKSTNASLVFTTSSVGLKGRAYWGSYSISKFATQGMMEVIADENENTSIRANCINPGGTRTNMRAQAYPAEDASKLKTPEEIMPLYLYLMSDASKHESGKTFHAQPK